MPFTEQRLCRRRRPAFTLIELVTVIVILGVVAAFAVPKFLDFKTDARLATIQADLGAMRTAIYNFRLNQIATGAVNPQYPTIAELTTPGTVLIDSVPPNPYSTGANPGQVVAGVTKGTTVTSGTTGGWCYLQSTGEIWADTNSGAGEKDL